MLEPEPEPGLMNWVSGFSTFLGLGKELENFFDGGGGDAALESWLANMFATLLTEIEQVFSQGLTEVEVATALGVAQTAQDFLAIDYVNAQQAQESDPQLWSLLSTDSSGPSLQALSAQASTMTTWAKDNATSLAQRTVSLALTIYSLIVALRRERAKHGPDRCTRAAEAASMRAYAALAASRIQPILNSVLQARLADISGVTAGSANVVLPSPGRGVMNPETTYYWLAVTDSWDPSSAPQPAPSKPPQVLMTLQNAGVWPNSDMATQMATARGMYIQLASGGSDSDMAQWSQQLTQLVTTSSYFQLQPPWNLPQATPTAPGLPALLTSVTATGGWLYGGRITLQSLDLLSLKGRAYVFSRTAGPASQHPIDFGGRLRAGAFTPPLQFPAQGAWLTAVVLSADVKHAYACFRNPGGTGNGAICQYAITADGTLWPTILSSLPTAATPTSLALSPDGRSAYVTAYAGSSPVLSANQVMQCSIAADGSLSPKSPAAVPAGAAPSAIAISADGKHAYVANGADSNVTHFPVAPDGTLSDQGEVPVAAGTSPMAIALSADGNSAYVANENSVSRYSIATDGTGTLSPQPPDLVIDHGVRAIALSSDGLSAYVVCAASSKVFQFSIGTGGTLSPKSPATVPTGNSPQAIALSDDGLCAYVPCGGDCTVWQYSIASDGTLSVLALPLPTPVQNPATTVQNPAPTVQNPAMIALLPVTGGPMVPSAPLGVTGTQTLVGSGFANVNAVAADPAGNVYVGDQTLRQVVRVAPGGTQTTIVSGLLPAASRMAVDWAGNVYVADASNYRVVKAALGGTQTTIAPGFRPFSVAVDWAGNVYAVDLDNNRVVKVTPGGTQTTIVSGWAFGPASVAVDWAGNLYLAEPQNDSVVKVAPGGIQTAIGSGFTNPSAVAVDPAGNVYVADRGSRYDRHTRVVKLTPGGTQTTVASGISLAACDVAVDWAGNVYLAVWPEQVVQVTLRPAALSGVPGSATITWAAPLSDGGAPITGYTVTAADSTNPANGGQTGTTSPLTATTCTVTGLTGGDSYTFTVTATNAAGTGPASKPSSPVIVTAPTGQP